MDTIVAFIASLGIRLEYFPEDKIWAYDDGEPCGLYIRVKAGINGLGFPSCWIEISNYTKENQTYSFSCTLSDWMECMSIPFKTKLEQLR